MDTGIFLILADDLPVIIRRVFEELKDAL